MSSHFDSVLAIFHGTADGARATDELLHAKFDDVYAKFVRALSTKSAVADTIIERFDNAPAVVQRRLIASHELCGIVLSQKHGPTPNSPVGDSTLRQLRLIVSKLLIAEGAYRDADTECVLGHRCTSFVSPLGDTVMTYGHNHDWVRTAVPKIGVTIALDYDSPLARQRDSSSVVFDLPLVEWSTNEKVSVYHKLSQAIYYIDEAVPAFGSLIRNFVRRIFLRKSLALGDHGQIIGEPLVRTSEYLTRYPGAIGLSNPHLHESTVVSLMETILHESIHSLMHCYETLYGDFMSADTSYRPVSPWSGHLIPNHGLAHAVFVYYACHHLLNRCVALGVFENKRQTDEAEARIADLAAGFCIDKELSSLFLTSSSGEGLYDVIRTMQESVKSTCHPELSAAIA